MRGDSFNTEKRNRYLGCLRKGMRQGEACRAAHIDRRTVWSYKKNHPEFQSEIDEAEADYCDQVEKHLLRMIKKLNVTAAIFWLTNRAPERWKDRRNVAQPQVQGTETEALKEIKERLDKYLKKEDSE